MTNRWTEKEIQVLRTSYRGESKQKLLELLPSRTWCAILLKAERLGILKRDGKSRHVHNNGYVLVRAPDYPESWRGRWKDGRVYEHCLAWYRARPNDPILSDEVIHHVNGDRTDNRIENLQKLKSVYHGALNGKSEPVKIDLPELPDVPSLLEEACREQIEGELRGERTFTGLHPSR